MRRDRLGRRIGHNWWRAYVCGLLSCADEAWRLEAEAASNGWATELAEWKAEHPRPTLREYLVHLAGTSRLEAA